jgi:hypothetical protein
MIEVQEQKKRKLASIQKITDIFPIEGADKIEGCRLLGWECVVKRGEFKVGDFVVYCEIDSIMPEKPEFEFLRERKFRIRTIRLKKQISQGIVLPLSILPPSLIIDKNNIEGMDITEVLGVKKYDLQLQEEKALDEQFHSKSKINKFFMNFALYRFIYFKLNRKDKGWPSWIAKTDEERIEVCLKTLTSRPDSEWYVSEKIDGQSASYFVATKKHWGIKKLYFGVCSRNVRLAKPNNSTYWKIADKYNICDKLLKLQKTGIVVQGEICGGKVQGNKYKLPELDFFVFNVIDNGIKYSLSQMQFFCKTNGLKTVPIMKENWIFNNAKRSAQEIIEEITQMSIGKSVLHPEIWREGLVFRLKNNPDISFKKINPEFLLKYP